jgi:hypothetical protein
MRYSDFLFLWVLFANLLLVCCTLGLAIIKKHFKLLLLQTNGEQIMTWFEGFNQKLQRKEPVAEQVCVPAQEGAASPEGAQANTWKECISTLFATSGPFHEYTNLLMPEDSPYASKCDKHELGYERRIHF